MQVECTTTQAKYLDRNEAAAYLTSQGLRISKATLQKFATVGGGPTYQRFGHRAVYTLSELDAWSQAKLSAPRCSTSAAAT